MYIHCWGGHGRTGTLVALVLGMLYEIPCSQALRYTQARLPALPASRTASRTTRCRHCSASTGSATTPLSVRIPSSCYRKDKDIVFRNFWKRGVQKRRSR